MALPPQERPAVGWSPGEQGPRWDGGPAARGATEPALQRPRGLRGFFSRYGRMLWWLHSLYALGLGVSVILFAQKGFAQARWLSISLGLAWIVLLLFFRAFGSGAKRRTVEKRGDKVRFYVMTYLLKNAYQGMLFFLLPFYWRSATLDTPTQWYVVALGVCAFLSTLDVVFDQVLMRFKSVASLFYFFTLFCCSNLVIPALFPNTRSLATLVAAAVVSALAFWTMHIPVRYLGRPSVVTLLVLWTTASLAGAYYGRRYVPPVAMHVSDGAVGPSLMPDGRLSIAAKALHTSHLGTELHAVTDVVVPGGRGDRLVHVWRKEGQDVFVPPNLVVEPLDAGIVRLRSSVARDRLPPDPAGSWVVDVETQDGQLVGRVRFEIAR